MTSPRIGHVVLWLLLAGGATLAQGADALPPEWHAPLARAATFTTPGERTVWLSQQFLGSPYRAGTLIGSAELPEQLTIRLDAVDCFTLLDYVEALRRSTTAAEFPRQLTAVRYRHGKIAWDHRRHFFTDWAAPPDGQLVDVTARLGGTHTRQAHKQLNRRADGRLFLPGVAVQARTINFIPPAAIDDALLRRLQSGDYLGIYTPAAGLDVSHVGIVIHREGRPYLRHASTHPEAGRVIDSPLAAYLSGKPGIVVLRPAAAR